MLTFATIVIALLTTTHAANDWAVPCTNGSCAYDFAGNEKTAPTSMLINGQNQILSDITPAAGWQILDCSPDWVNGTHAIRMVCAGTPQQTAHCSHLNDNGGAPHTVVRLPDTCGKGPFAHVNGTFTPNNQSVPFNVTRQDGSSPKVHGLILDYDFEGIPESRGTLNLSLTSSNADSPTPVQRRGRSRIYTRGAVASAAPPASTSESQKTASIPIKLNQQSFTLVDTSIKCQASQANLVATANLKIDVDANIDAAVAFGYTFSGSIVPLKINDLSMFATLTGQALATFHIQTLVQGTFNSGSLTLFKSGLPGLSIPGIISVGPTFSISSASALAGIQFGAAASIATDTKFPNLQFKFPQSTAPESVLPQVDANSFQLSASTPSVDFKGQIVAHVIPRMDFGVTLGVSSAATAGFFMTIDLSGTATLQFRAGASAAQAAKAAAVAPATPPAAAAAVAVAPAASPVAAAAASPAAAVARRAIPVNGCVDVSVGVNINGGVTGSIPGIITKSQSFPVFSTSKPLFTKCVGTGFGPAAPAPSARSISGGSTVARAARYASLEVEKRVAAAPFKISPPTAAPPTLGSAPAAGTLSQSTNPAINLLKPQTSTASTAQLACGNVKTVSDLSKLF